MVVSPAFYKNTLMQFVAKCMTLCTNSLTRRSRIRRFIRLPIKGRSIRLKSFKGNPMSYGAYGGGDLFLARISAPWDNF
jgi:hypothetical protein